MLTLVNRRVHLFSRYVIADTLPVDLRRGLANLALALCMTTPSAAQLIQAGIAGWPGVGAQISYVDLGSVFSVESGVQMDMDPFANPRALHVTVIVGAAFLPLSAWRIIGQIDYVFDVDVGIRVAPRLIFVENATKADKNQQFGLAIDPFLRYRRALGTGTSRRSFYVEIGPTRPTLRVGLWLDV